MAKVIMIQGTMSNAGKSFLVAGLCRILRQDGHRAAPFKSQNMALNSYITGEGLEMGRAQVMQAEAAGISPMVCMNPVLLKPTDHTGSQVIVRGEVWGNMSAREYFAWKKGLVPVILEAFRELEQYADYIVVEGAGSPAEINLRENDIVNMGLAEMLDAPVLLVGDIDRGGVFAQLLGTLMLLTEAERARVKGLFINKFRGDASLLETGITMLEQRGKVPVLGVIPYMDIALEDEDSLTERFERRKAGRIDIAVIRYPRISNFTDFNVFEQMPGLSVRYVAALSELGEPDMIMLPGSKNTMEDLRWMRLGGLEEAVRKLAGQIPVFGICGGFQMLGEGIRDPEGVEGGGYLRGMGLLPVETRLEKEKVRRRREGRVNELDGVLSTLSGLACEGYEIHMGRSVRTDTHPASLRRTEEGSVVCFGADGLKSRCSAAEEMPLVCTAGGGRNVYGTYLHGIFDRGEVAGALVRALAEAKGVELGNREFEDYRNIKEEQYDKLADTLRRYLDMEKLYGIFREARLERRDR